MPWLERGIIPIPNIDSARAFASNLQSLSGASECRRVIMDDVGGVVLL